jgi:hypothetical protein
MIEAVSTVRLQATSLKASPREVSAVASSGDVPVLKTRYRVDSQRDVVIFEYRDQEGTVINQYPTEAQIRAFKRAAESDVQVSTAVAAPKTSGQSQQADGAGFEAPAVSASLSAGSAAAASRAVSTGDDAGFSSLV